MKTVSVSMELMARIGKFGMYKVSVRLLGTFSDDTKVSGCWVGVMANDASSVVTLGGS